MLKRGILYLLFIVIFMNYVLAGESEVKCNLYDDFSGESLDPEKWEETLTRTGAGSYVDEHYLDTGNQNYHAAQLTPADRGVELKLLYTLQEEDILEFDYIYNSASGNHWGCAFWVESSSWIGGITCIGHWNEINAYNGQYGTYHYQAFYKNDKIEINRTLPDGTLESWSLSAGWIVRPYTFSIVSRTGGDGTLHFDLDDLKLCYINYAPEIESYSPLEEVIKINETESIEFTHTSTDQNEDELTYSWKLDDIEQSIEQNWIYISDYYSAGNHNITLTVTDGSLETSQEWYVIVNNINRAPVLELIEDIIANEGDLVQLNPIAIDPDGDEVEIIYFTILDETGAWQTNYYDAGEYTVTVSVSDGELQDEQEVTITVNNVNQLPVLNITIDNQTWNEDTSLDNVFDLNDYFYDLDNQTLAYSVLGNSSIIIEIDENNIVSFSQPANWFGVEEIYFIADDSEDTTNSNNITLIVNDVAEPSSGGGSSGGGGSNRCLENWNCNVWSGCINSNRTRTCNDLNNCGTEANKPKESEPCSSTSGSSHTNTTSIESEKTEKYVDDITGATVTGNILTRNPIASVIVVLLVIVGSLITYFKIFKKKKKIVLNQNI